ncbi:MAG: transaldolase [Proteobacteria bacterium]|nr:transaldolase [Pseudomonadota bacterium]
MKYKRPTQKLHDLGQSIWLDHITRGLVSSTPSGLDCYIRDFSVTGLTSNPTIFDKAIKSGEYDSALELKHYKSPENLFFELAIEDLKRAAKSFRSVYDRTDGVDGWVSLEVSPLLTHDSAKTLAAATTLIDLAAEPNIFIKIPGTKAGLIAIENAIFAGVPVNVTLLFSREQYVACAEAYMRGIERRIIAGLSANVASVASIFISRWDVAVSKKIPETLENQLGIAVGKRTYASYRRILDSDRWQRLANLGARPQRLLFASTGTKDPTVSELLYVQALAAPLTINTMPKLTLKALADHGSSDITPIPIDGGDAETTLAYFAKADIDIAVLADQLQEEGVAACVESWNDLISVLAAKATNLSLSRTSPKPASKPNLSGVDQ